MKSLYPLVGMAAVLASGSAQAQEFHVSSYAGAPPVIIAQADSIKAQEAAKQQLEAAQAQVERTQTQVEKIQHDLDRRIGRFPATGGIGGFGGGMVMGAAPGPRNTGPLIVRSSEADQKDQSALSEDLAIMGHILEKAADETTGPENRAPQAMGIDLFMQPGGSRMRQLYLEDYGALFVLNVNFPLIAPSQKTNEEAKASTDSSWEDAKRELYGDQRERLMPGGPVESYSQERVDKLRNALIDALKNAANIRALKPNESITICIVGGANSEPVVREIKRGGGVPNRAIVLQGKLQATAPTIMTIRIKKEDAEKFATSKMSQEDFRKQARVVTYLGGPETGGPQTMELRSMQMER